MRPAVFLDRDDTLVHCANLPVPEWPAKAGDTVDPALVALLPGVLAACALLRSAGFVLVVVSNQGTVARGGAGLEVVERVNERMRERLTPSGEHWPLIEATYYCPYHPEGRVERFTREHEWRKPQGGMVRDAAAELDLDLGASWLIGDAPRDVESGVAAGLDRSRCLLVGAGAPFAGMPQAAAHILRNQ